MLAQIRKVSRSWVAGVIIAPLMLLLVVGLGLNADIARLVQPPTTVASGKGVSISIRKFQQEFDQQLDRVREQSPNQEVTREAAIRAGFQNTVLQNLINDAALNAAMDQIGLAASDKAVARTIREIPGVLSEVTGRFDQERFNRLIAANGFISQGQFTEQVRADLRRNQFGGLIEDGLPTPSAITRLLFDLQTEQRQITVAQISEQSITLPARPSDQELEAFYKKEAAERFSLPERRKLTIFAARAGDFRDKVQVDETALKELYEARKKQKSAPERRSFVQVSAPNKAGAAEAARRLAAGEDPEAIAKAVGGAAATFTDKAREEVVDKTVAEAVFRRQAGETIAPVQGVAKAWLAAKVVQITPAVTPTFEALRNDLREERIKEESERLAADAGDDFQKRIEQGEAPEAAAQQAGLQAVSVGPLAKDGRDPQSGQTLWPKGPLLDEAFTLPVGEQTQYEPIEGGYGIARVDAIAPAGPVPLAQVRDIVEKQYLAAEVTKRAKAVAEQLRGKIQQTGDFDSAAKAFRAAVMFRSRPFSRAMLQRAPDPSIAGDIFGAKEGDVIVTFGGGWVVRIDKIEKGDPAQQADLYKQAEAQARNQLLQDLAYAVQTKAVAEAKVKTNSKLVAKLFPKPADNE